MWAAGSDDPRPNGVACGLPDSWGGWSLGADFGFRGTRPVTPASSARRSKVRGSLGPPTPRGPVPNRRPDLNGSYTGQREDPGGLSAAVTLNA